jgi:hypothetical protein
MKSRRKFYKSAIPAALCALVVLFGPAVARAQHGGGAGGGGHTDEAHDTDPGHLLHDPGHGGQRGGGHGDGGTGGHGSHEGRRGAGRADIEDTIFRWGGEGYHGGIEERIFRQEQRPVWAGGAVPEDLELGRLNVARAPASTRERALQEVYSSNLDKDGDGNIDADADLGTVDSPVANLALYEQALEQGSWTLGQAAMFLGHASDKTIPISVQTVEAVNLILGIPTDDTGISEFSYDRNAAYPAEIVNAVFDGQAYVGNGIDAFARAADDERAVTLYLHDHPEALPGS